MGSEPGAGAPAPRTPSVLVLGTDTVLAAQPATPVQLAHACLRAGYQQVIPASWGDELVAHAVLQRLSGERPGPAVQCSCPLVASRLLAAGPELRPFLVSVATPAVAVARYLRAAYRGAVRITYAGRCPGAAADEIEVRMTPEELLATLTARGIVIEEQPRVFDSVIPPDRRRFWSQPGGVPTAEALWAEGGERALIELTGDDLSIELTEILLAGRRVLVDPGTRLGCHCAGATHPPSGAVDPEAVVAARARVIALEPPRAGTPVLRAPDSLDLEPPEPSRRVASDRQAGPPAPVPLADLPPTQRETPESVPALPNARRKSPPHGTARPLLGAAPTTRDAEGRHLPRTYVARRRSSTPRPFRVQLDLGEIEPTQHAAAGGLAAVPESTPAPMHDAAPEAQLPRDHEIEVPLASHSDSAVEERATGEHAVVPAAPAAPAIDSEATAESDAGEGALPAAEAAGHADAAAAESALAQAAAAEAEHTIPTAAPVPAEVPLEATPEAGVTEEPQVVATPTAVEPAVEPVGEPVSATPRPPGREGPWTAPVVDGTAHRAPGARQAASTRPINGGAARTSAAQRARPSAAQRIAVVQPPRRRGVLLALALILVAAGSIALGVFLGQRYFMRPVQATPRQPAPVAGTTAPPAETSPAEPATATPTPPKSAADTLLIDTM